MRRCARVRRRSASTSPDAIESVCKAVPDLAGFFTITGVGEPHELLGPSYRGRVQALRPARPGRRTRGASQDLQGGDRSGRVASQRLIIWDWGWLDAAADATIEELPPGVDFMSVSEWGIPIERGGVKTAVGEYSISVIGPGERASHRWDLARRKGLAKRSPRSRRAIPGNCHPFRTSPRSPAWPDTRPICAMRARPASCSAGRSGGIPRRISMSWRRWAEKPISPAIPRSTRP